ncbi:hypothetical protein IMSHALPRED_006347 [Imshaugia aleurites]|uniref:Rhodopsin domain-containing protein n=1 Tax=Imshaugia aleurites TaxID=172621 RepID=A0A8H3IMZ3_9LECA|nr:hypothetical protein IMSHALPRED_006347 [Imshaugia aleurites]
MSPFDDTGRIHKRPLLISNSVLFGVCLASVSIRYYVRFFIQKQVSIDDGILLFGILCLISAMVLLFIFVDDLFLVEALEGNTIPADLPVDFLQGVFDFERLVVGALVLTWCAIISVKFSYLFLFRKLIDRLRPMVIYWWVAVVFNALISIYGIIIYAGIRPWYCTTNSVECLQGNGLDRSFAFAISQMVLDIVGDLLILFIPFHLIWRIKVRLSQKIVLASTLCLIVLTIMCTIIRVAGVRTSSSDSSLDTAWQTYWQYITANIALTMTAATAFRTFYISRHQDRPAQRQESNKLRLTRIWRFFIFVLRPWSWRGKSIALQDSEDSSNRGMELPWIEERATMTGMRTFINRQGEFGED